MYRSQVPLNLASFLPLGSKQIITMIYNIISIKLKKNNQMIYVTLPKYVVESEEYSNLNDHQKIFIALIFLFDRDAAETQIYHMCSHDVKKILKKGLLVSEFETLRSFMRIGSYDDYNMSVTLQDHGSKMHKNVHVKEPHCGIYDVHAINTWYYLAGVYSHTQIINEFSGDKLQYSRKYKSPPRKMNPLFRESIGHTKPQREYYVPK
jgi:hypothetical protein